MECHRAQASLVSGKCFTVSYCLDILLQLASASGWRGETWPSCDFIRAVNIPSLWFLEGHAWQKMALATLPPQLTASRVLMASCMQAHEGTSALLWL